MTNASVKFSLKITGSGKCGVWLLDATLWEGKTPAWCGHVEIALFTCSQSILRPSQPQQAPSQTFLRLQAEAVLLVLAAKALGAGGVERPDEAEDRHDDEAEGGVVDAQGDACAVAVEALVHLHHKSSEPVAMCSRSICTAGACVLMQQA